MLFPGLGSIAWHVRSRLDSNARRNARRLADRLLSPVGSINGIRTPSALVALTFDDGPAPPVTAQLLDLLADYRARATFFVLTTRVMQCPELVRRMLAEGHEVALHSDRHERLTEIRRAEVMPRLRAARDSLEAVTCRPVRFFRPPFGAQSLSTYIAARRCGLDIVVWGPCAEDWIDDTPEAVAGRGLARLQGGDILLLHDGLETPDGATTSFDRLRMFQLTLDGLAARGLHAATVGELLAEGEARRTAWFRP